MALTTSGARPLRCRRHDPFCASPSRRGRGRQPCPAPHQPPLGRPSICRLAARFGPMRSPSSLCRAWGPCWATGGSTNQHTCIGGPNGALVPAFPFTWEDDFNSAKPLSGPVCRCLHAPLNLTRIGKPRTVKETLFPQMGAGGMACLIPRIVGIRYLQCTPNSNDCWWMGPQACVPPIPPNPVLRRGSDCRGAACPPAASGESLSAAVPPDNPVSAQRRPQKLLTGKSRPRSVIKNFGP